MCAIHVVDVDWERAEHGRAVVEMLDAYARDPMGRGEPLPEEVLGELVPGLRAFPTAIVLLAFDDRRPVGIAVCFLGFSTFAARPLVNVHDLAVVPEYRGRGAARRLLEAVESRARERGCCKVTLEVQTTNHRARRVYEAAGFTSVKWQESGGDSLFLAKPLSP